MDPTTLPYRYFVTFSNGRATGNTEIRLTRPIRSLDDINAIQDNLRSSVAGAVVVGWQRFEN